MGTAGTLESGRFSDSRSPSSRTSAHSPDWSISSAASNPVDRLNSMVSTFHTLALPLAYVSMMSLPPTKTLRSGPRAAGIANSLHRSTDVSSAVNE
jgi:hypothetical protein